MWRDRRGILRCAGPLRLISSGGCVARAARCGGTAVSENAWYNSNINLGTSKGENNFNAKNVITDCEGREVSRQSPESRFV